MEIKEMFCKWAKRVKPGVSIIVNGIKNKNNGINWDNYKVRDLQWYLELS